MAIFSRKRRVSDSDPSAGGGEPIPLHLLPEVNQRVTVSHGQHVPVPSRVEDIAGGVIMLADPTLPLEFGDRVVVAWERDNAWFSLESRILGIDELAHVPTVHVAARGRLARYDERRTDLRREVDLPIDLRVTRARAIQSGRVLGTRTTEVSGTAVRFVTSAPFAPGDVVEATIRLADGPGGEVGARLRIIRIDSVTGSWRQHCTAVFDEILRADRARILALISVQGTQPQPDIDARGAVTRAVPGAAAAPTLDGVGGRDEPEHLGTFDDVVGWLKRRRLGGG